MRDCCALKRGLFSRKVSPETYLSASDPCGSKEDKSQNGETVVKLNATGKKGDNTEEKFLAAVSKGQMEKGNKNFSKAVCHFKESLRIIEGNNFGCLATQGLSELGATFFAMESYGEALEAFLRMESEADTARDMKGLKTAKHNIATVYDMIDNHEEAIRYYNEKIRISLEIDDVVGLDATHNDLAEAYLKTDCVEKATEHFQKAFKLAGANNNNDEERFACRRLGEIFYSAGKYKRSLRYKLKQLKFAVGTGDALEELDTNKAIGSIYCTLKQYSEAERYYQDALRIACTLGDQRNVKTAEEDLAILGKIMDASGNDH